MTNIHKGRFTELAESLKSKLLHIKDTHLPTIRGYGELGRAKGLRAVNSGALKVVDALEGAGMMRQRQANKARIGILSADAYDTMPDFVFDRPTPHPQSRFNGDGLPEQRKIRENIPISIREKMNDVSLTDAYGKERRHADRNNINNPNRVSRYLADMTGGSDYFRNIHHKKLDARDEVINLLSLKGVPQKKLLEVADEYDLTIKPTWRRMTRMGEVEQSSVPKLRASYQSLRNKAGLGLLAGAGAGGLALLMANRKKNEPSSGSGKVNKSMAKRATMQKGRFTELARSLGAKAVRGAKQVMRADPIGMIKDAYVPHIANSLPLRLKRQFQAGQIALEDKAAHKIVDTLERSQIITPKQAFRARLGIEQSQKNTSHRWLTYPLSSEKVYQSDSTGFDTYRKLTGKDLESRRHDQRDRAIYAMRDEALSRLPEWQQGDAKLYGLRPNIPQDIADVYNPRINQDKLGRKLSNAVNELSDTYNDVRFGLRRGALIGGLGLGALALSNRKKENTPSSSGKMNKSMAKRAMPTKAQSPSNKYL